MKPLLRYAKSTRSIVSRHAELAHRRGKSRSTSRGFANRSIDTNTEGPPVPKYPSRPFISFVAALTADEFAAQKYLITDVRERLEDDVGRYNEAASSMVVRSL